MILFESADPRTALFFPRAMPEEPDVPIQPLIGTWLPVIIPERQPWYKMKVLWEAAPVGDRGTWSIALVESQDGPPDWAARNVVCRVEATPSEDGKYEVTLPLYLVVGLQYWMLVLYHTATERDVRVRKIEIENVEREEEVSRV